MKICIPHAWSTFETNWMPFTKSPLPRNKNICYHSICQGRNSSQNKWWYIRLCWSNGVTRRMVYSSHQSLPSMWTRYRVIVIGTGGLDRTKSIRRSVLELQVLTGWCQHLHTNEEILINQSFQDLWSLTPGRKSFKRNTWMDGIQWKPSKSRRPWRMLTGHR